MKYTKNSLMGSEIIVAKHKGVTMTLAEGDDWVSIYSCTSKNEGKGEVQEAITIIKQDYKKTLYGSVPLCNSMKHIFLKMGIKYETNYQKRTMG